MVNTLPTPQNLIADTWMAASWEEYTLLADHPTNQAGRCYYDQGWMRIEMSALGPLHGRENSIVSTLVVLFITLKNIRGAELTNTTFRKIGIRDCQPDIAFYLGSAFRLPALDNAPVNVDEFGAPQLAIEIASTSLSDDLGRKRLLYERLGVQEYWVVDVAVAEVFAFEVADGGSKQIRDSQVLPGLPIALIEEALQRSQTQEDGEINRWLLQVFNG
ncbi:MAG: Uma2 family endonuclease [Aphanocapsa sp. GSE-SYN-MK-11-07L]|jgi:Uma2 family endonuclease|nr:Uma2 family endonuclease [Aphanocapsa sp. GSE-SYN-MK-11-07L]